MIHDWARGSNLDLLQRKVRQFFRTARFPFKEGH